MNKWISLFLLILSLQLNAEIIEVEHFADLAKYVKSDSLVILDIDDTLLVPVQTLGTDVWFQYRFDTHKKELTRYYALDKALAEWEAVRHLTKMKIVEEGTDAIIKNLQDAGLTVMGLSTQGLALTARTLMQLKTLNINIAQTAPSEEDHYFMNTQGVLYRGGVLFTSGTCKGDALIKFLDMIHLQPKNVVFINDKYTHLDDVGQVLQAKGIPFTGLRYSYSDERVAKFDPALAEIQWTHSNFGEILSDTEAQAILDEQKKKAA